MSRRPCSRARGNWANACACAKRPAWTAISWCPPVSTARPGGRASSIPITGPYRWRAMFEPVAAPTIDLVGSSAAVCEAVLKLRGDALHAELGRIAGALLGCPEAVFVAGATASARVAPADALACEVMLGADCLGAYRLSGRPFGPEDERQLESL